MTTIENPAKLVNPAHEAVKPYLGVSIIHTGAPELTQLDALNSLLFYELDPKVHDEDLFDELSEALENPDEEAVKDALLNVVEALDGFSPEGYRFDERNGELGFWKV